MKLSAKLFINGHIKTLTGLSIGGSESDVAIGGIDNTVIKTSEGVPYIPGSSIKGKLRSLLEKKEGKAKVCDCGKCYICAIFGTGAPNQEPEVGAARLYTRDANMNEKIKTLMEEKKGIFSELELNYTEGKWENVIDRKTSKAEHPRQMERVPAGVKFDFNMVFNLMDEEDIDRFKQVIIAMRLLEDDYLGSSGSRGYGRIKFTDVNIGIKTKTEYEGDNKVKSLYEGLLVNINFEELQNKMSEKLGEV